MISFIIIGKNEEKNLKRCIDSIYSAISQSHVNKYEIIYVDSKSTDRSIEVAQEFPEVRTFQITGPSNAALGRNVGAKQATGSVLYFIDGDMAIHGDFLARVWDAGKQDINEGFVAGHWLDKFGTTTTKRVMSNMFSGGTFLIRRELWQSVNGMRSRFRTGEESDLSLRLMEKGVYFRRINEIITDHYTVPYEHESRIWKRLWDKSLFYSRSVMFRHHLFNKNMYKLLWKIDKTFILLVASLLACFLYLPVGLAMLGCYLIAVTLRVARNKRYMSFIKMIAYFILLDSLNLVYIFTFYPKDLKEEYVEVRRKVLQA